MANLYQLPGETSYILKHLLEIIKSFLASGPLWLLQLWLNTTFKPKLQIATSRALIVYDDCKTIEGTILALTTPQETHS